MAARYSTGTISALGYAQTLMSMSATVFLTALNTALLPLFSQQVAEEGLASFRKTFVPTIRVLVTFLIPLCVLLIVLQKPVIQVVFERGAFDIQATTLTAPAFAAYMLGVLPMAITFLCSRGFNAQQDSKTNALIGVLLYVVVKIVMNVLLSRVWGYLGLALATSIAYAATAVAMLWVMWRRLGGLEGRRLFQTGGKTLVASFFAGVLAWWGAILGGNNPLLQLGLGGGLALIGFGLFSYTLKLEDAQRLFNVIIQTAWNQGRVILHGESRQ
jgi:putative peptidoglycan lipid II flippase